MKKIISIFSLVMVFVLGSCIEQNYPLWEGAEVEFQDAVTRVPAPGLTFPRIPVANTVGTVNLQVNFVSAHRANDEVITMVLLFLVFSVKLERNKENGPSINFVIDRS